MKNRKGKGEREKGKSSQVLEREKKRALMRLVPLLRERSKTKILLELQIFIVNFVFVPEFSL